MNAVIYIEITQEPTLLFSKPFIQKMNKVLDKEQWLFFDFDNHSDEYTIQCAGSLLGEAEKVYLIIEASEGTIFKILPFFNKLIKSKDKVNVYLNGENLAISKMLKVFKGRLYKNLSESELLSVFISGK